MPIDDWEEVPLDSTSNVDDWEEVPINDFETVYDASSANEEAKRKVEEEERKRQEELRKQQSKVPERGLLGYYSSKAARGMVGAAELGARAVDVTLGGTGPTRKAVEYLKELPEEKEFLKPDVTEGVEGESKLARWSGSALESAPATVSAMVPAIAGAKLGGAIGTAITPGLGTAIGAAGGGLIGGAIGLFGIMGLGTYDQRKEEVNDQLSKTRPELTAEERDRVASKNAFEYAKGELVGEGASDLAGAIILSRLPGGRVAYKGGKAMLKDMLAPGFTKQIGKAMATQMPFEMGGEALTSTIQHYADVEAGTKEGKIPLSGKVVDAMGTAMFMSAGFGVAAGSYSQVRGNKTLSNLNSEDEGVRLKTIKDVSSTIKGITKDKDIASEWQKRATELVKRGEQIPIDVKFSSFIADQENTQTDEEKKLEEFTAEYDDKTIKTVGAYNPVIQQAPTLSTVIEQNQALLGATPSISTSSLETQQFVPGALEGYVSGITPSSTGSIPSYELATEQLEAKKQPAVTPLTTGTSGVGVSTQSLVPSQPTKEPSWSVATKVVEKAPSESSGAQSEQTSTPVTPQVETAPTPLPAPLTSTPAETPTTPPVLPEERGVGVSGVQAEEYDKLKAESPFNKALVEGNTTELFSIVDNTYKQQEAEHKADMKLPPEQRKGIPAPTTRQIIYNSLVDRAAKDGRMLGVNENLTYTGEELRGEVFGEKAEKVVSKGGLEWASTEGLHVADTPDGQVHVVSEGKSRHVVYLDGKPTGKVYSSAEKAMSSVGADFDITESAYEVKGSGRNYGVYEKSTGKKINSVLNRKGQPKPVALHSKGKAIQFIKAYEKDKELNVKDTIAAINSVKREKVKRTAPAQADTMATPEVVGVSSATTEPSEVPEERSDEVGEKAEAASEVRTVQATETEKNLLTHKKQYKDVAEQAKQQDVPFPYTTFEKFAEDFPFGSEKLKAILPTFQRTKKGLTRVLKTQEEIRAAFSGIAATRKPGSVSKVVEMDKALGGKGTVTTADRVASNKSPTDRVDEVIKSVRKKTTILRQTTTEKAKEFLQYRKARKEVNSIPPTRMAINGLFEKVDSNVVAMGEVKERVVRITEIIAKILDLQDTKFYLFNIDEVEAKSRDNKLKEFGGEIFASPSLPALEKGFVRDVILENMQDGEFIGVDGLVNFTESGLQDSIVISYRPNDSLFKTVNTLAHELGHIVQLKILQRLLTNKPYSKETAIRDALLRDYAEWFVKSYADKGTTGAAAWSLKGSSFAEELIEMTKEGAGGLYALEDYFDPENNSGIPDEEYYRRRDQAIYFSSFSEWFADNVAKYVTTEKAATTELGKVFEGIADIFREFLEKLHVMFPEMKLWHKDKPAESIRMFLKDILSYDLVESYAEDSMEAGEFEIEGQSFVEVMMLDDYFMASIEPELDDRKAFESYLKSLQTEEEQTEPVSKKVEGLSNDLVSQAISVMVDKQSRKMGLPASKTQEFISAQEEVKRWHDIVESARKYYDTGRPWPRNGKIPTHKEWLKWTYELDAAKRRLARIASSLGVETESIPLLKGLDGWFDLSAFTGRANKIMSLSSASPIAYHGTPHELRLTDEQLSGQKLNWLGPGFNLSTSKEDAHYNYGGNATGRLYSYIVKMKRPFYANDPDAEVELTEDESNRFIEAIPFLKQGYSEEYAERFDSLQEELQLEASTAGLNTTDIWDMFQEFFGDNKIVDTDGDLVSAGYVLNGLLRGLGYDGIVFNASLSEEFTGGTTGNVTGMTGIKEDTTHYLVFDKDSSLKEISPLLARSKAASRKSGVSSLGKPTRKSKKKRETPTATALSKVNDFEGQFMSYDMTPSSSFEGKPSVSRDNFVFASAKEYREKRKARREAMRKEFEETPEQIREKLGREYSRKAITKRQTKSLLQSIEQNISDALGSAYDRLQSISPEMARIVNKYLQYANQKNAEHKKRMAPFVQLLGKMPRLEMLELGVYLSNGQTKDLVEIERIFKKYPGLETAYKAVEKVLAEIRVSAEEAGLVLDKEVKHYFPRRVSDVKGLREYLEGNSEYASAVKDELDEMERKLGRTMMDDEKQEVLKQLLSNGRYYGHLSKPGALKKRAVPRVTAEMSIFYDNPIEALLGHVLDMNEAIGQRRLIGFADRKDKLRRLHAVEEKMQSMSPEGEKFDSLAMEREGILKYLTSLETDGELQNSLQAFLQREVDKGTISGKDLDEVFDIVRSRLLQKGMHGLTSTFRNVTLLTTLTDFSSVLTQTTEIFSSLLTNGYIKAIGGTVKTVVGGSEIDISKMDLQPNISEYQGLGTTAAVSKVLRATGFTFADIFTKRARMQATLDRLRGYAQRSNTKRFDEFWKPYFGEDFEQFKTDLKTGKMSDLVMEMLWADLLNWQPIDVIASPKRYMTAGNWRILGLLKMFNLRLLNALYRESIGKMRKGGVANAVKGAGVLFHAVLLWTMLGAGKDELENMILGKREAITDNMLNNLLSLVFLSKYDIEKLKEDDPATVILRKLIPPTKIVKVLFNDTRALLEGKPVGESLALIPGVGKYLYAQTEKGKSKQAKKNKEYFTKEIKRLMFNPSKLRELQAEVMAHNREMALAGRKKEKLEWAPTLARLRMEYRKEQLGISKEN